MSRRAAQIVDGQVVNVILIADDADPGDWDAEVLPDDSPVGPGWQRSSQGKYAPPPAPEPLPEPDRAALAEALTDADDDTLRAVQAALDRRPDRS